MDRPLRLRVRLFINNLGHEGMRVWLVVFCLFFLGSCSGVATIDGPTPFVPTTNYFSSASPLNARGKKTDVMTLDGQNKKIFFPANDVPVIMVSSGKTLIVQNVTLVGFRPTHLQLQDAAAQFLFGSGVTLSLEADLDLTKTMTVTGSLSIQGNGNVLSLSSKLPLLVGNAAVLEINRCTLKGMGDWVNAAGTTCSSIACAPTACLRLKNTTCQLDSSWSFTSGTLDLVGDVVFKGMQQKFSYSSPGLCSLAPYAVVSFMRGMTFFYQCPAGRSNLVLDATSRLFFDGSSFVCGNSGLTLSAGQLFLKNDVSFATTTQDKTKGFILDASLLTAILSNASMLVDGTVAYGQPV